MWHQTMITNRIAPLISFSCDAAASEFDEQNIGVDLKNSMSRQTQ